MQGFLVLGCGIRIGDDACANMKVPVIALADECADGDIELAFSIPSQIADRSSVESSGRRL